MGQDSIVTFDHVCIAYRAVQAVNDVCCSITQGDFVCVVGRNGSGKSSLVRSLFGLAPVVSGRVLTAVDPDRIAYMPQSSSIPHDLIATVREVVLTGMQTRSGRPFYTQAQRDRADDCLRTLGIDELRDRSIGALSGGQRQKVLLARALCRDPQMLVLDEPSAGLDEASCREFYELLRALNERGVTIVLVTHDRSEVVHSARTVLELDGGVVFYGSCDEWLAREVLS